MRNNTAGILAFAGATLFTLSGTYHGYSLFRNFKSIGGALPGSPKAIPSSIRNLCYCDKPKGYTCGSHHLHRYQSFPSWYIVPVTNKQMAFPPNNTTARSTEESIHLSWLACLRHLRYDIPNGFHVKLKIPMAHYPAFIGAIRVFIAHLCYGIAHQDLP